MYLLTDFTTERWKGIDLDSVKTSVETLKEKLNKMGCAYGELGKPETFEISLNKASHAIKNITFENDKIYGDVEFLNNSNGKVAERYINDMNGAFGIRSVGFVNRNDDNKITIHVILTWDVTLDEEITKIKLKKEFENE